MTANTNIRKAIPTDVSSILGFIKELAVFEKSPNAVEITEQDLLKDGFSDAPKFFCFVAEMEGKLVGMALCYTAYSTWKGETIYLEDLIVSEAYRGGGIGKSLLEEVIREGQRRQVRRIDWAVLNWNTPAINFYKQIGANVLEEWQIAQMNEQAISKYFKN